MSFLKSSHTYELKCNVVLIDFWPEHIKPIALFVYVYIWPSTADMFLIQLPFIKKKKKPGLVYRVMNLLCGWELNEMLCFNNNIWELPSRAASLTSWHMLQGWEDGSASLDPGCFYEPTSKASDNSCVCLASLCTYHQCYGFV